MAANASSSLSTSLSTAPLSCAWMCDAAELLLGDHLADAALDHGRPGDEELARAFHHDARSAR